MTSLPSWTRVRAEGVSKGGVAGKELTNSESIRFSFRDLVRIMRQELLPLGEQSKTVSKSPPHLHPVIVANILGPIPRSQSYFQPVHLFRGDLVHLFKAKPSFPCNRINLRECLSSSLFLQIPLAANPFLYSSNVRSKKSAGLRVGLRQRITIDPAIKIENLCCLSQHSTINM